MDFDNNDYAEHEGCDVEDSGLDCEDIERYIDDYMIKLSEFLNWIDRQEIISIINSERYHRFVELSVRVRKLFPEDKYKFGESFKVDVDVRSGVGTICVYVKDQEFFGDDVSEFADICLSSGDVEIYSLTSGVTRIGFAQYELFKPIGGKVIDR